MPAPLTHRSTWPAPSRLFLLVLALLALPGSLAAQNADALGLRLSRELGAPAPPVPPETAGEEGGVRLQSAPEIRRIGNSSIAPARSNLKVTEALLQADVNVQKLDDPVIALRREDGAILVDGEDLDRWRLRRPEGAPLEREGKLYYLLTDLPGLIAEVDERKQALVITAPPGAFTNTAGSVAGTSYPAAVRPQPGGFFNYTLSATQSSTASNQNGLFEAGFFNSVGVLTSSVLSPDVTAASGWLRLDTTFAMDDPASMTSIRLGDTITRSGTWGRSVRLGGGQWSTNFGTQPGFVRSPVLQASGSAALPSMVDVYVNNALVQRSTVPPGPFTIQNIPVVSGSGQVQVVVRDLLGREQIITQPFYSSPTLLRQGVSDWSYEAGALRDNFGLESNDYGTPVTIATYRRGLTDTFTAELHGEASRDVRAIGASPAVRAGDFGVVSGTFAGSQGEAGSGHLIGAGVERLTAGVSVAAQAFFASAGFRQIGMAPNELPRRRQLLGTISYAMGERGSLSAAFTRQDFRDQPPVETTSLTYALPILKTANLSVTFLRSAGASEASSVFATISIPFGELTSGTVVMDRTRDATTGVTESNTTVTAQKALPAGDGYGYRLQLRNRDFLGSGSLQNGYGTYTLEASQPREGDPALRLGAAGGIGYVGGHAFLSRVLNDSFGLVRVADFADVRVLQDNQIVGRTDADGYAVLPRLRPYDRNQVTIDHNDLPFDASLSRLRLEAVPYLRSGVLLEFPVRRVRAATVHLVLEDGSFLPSGALARFEGSSQDFPVALNGEAYLEGFEESNRVVFTWRGRSCTVDIPYPRTTKDVLPDLGTFLCKGVVQ
jgi:outer membrane usher protein